jgi:hypothetical protein
MTFARGATRSGYIRADQAVQMFADKNGTNRVKLRTAGEVMASAGRLGKPGAPGRPAGVPQA